MIYIVNALMEMSSNRLLIDVVKACPKTSMAYSFSSMKIIAIFEQALLS